MKLIDSHCHLNYDYAPKSVDDLIREARKAGVVKFITIGTEIKTITTIQEISEKYPEVFHTVGVHPHDSIDLSDAELPLLKAAGQHPKCRAIGEIGLDYHYDHSPRDVQMNRFRDQAKIALELGLPIVIHSREGEEDLLTLLREYASGVAPGSIPGVIHCFTGTRGFGEKCLELGFYISFSGIVTFKKAEEVHECARAFPLERLLVETDSPYLAPIPYRGKKCEPSMVKMTAMKLAELKGATLEEIARITSANTERVFKI